MHLHIFLPIEFFLPLWYSGVSSLFISLLFGKLISFNYFCIHLLVSTALSFSTIANVFNFPLFLRLLCWIQASGLRVTALFVQHFKKFYLFLPASIVSYGKLSVIWIVYFFSIRKVLGVSCCFHNLSLFYYS